MGLLDASVSINGFANVVTEGLLAGLNTASANAGDPVWLGTDGNLIYGLLNKPSAPAHLVFIGIVTRANANNGEIFVKVQNGFELDELHDLSVKNPSDGDMIKYVASTGLWTKIAASTTNIVEGTNLYYTDARVGTYLTNNSYATQSYVNTAVSNLVDAAPGTLDTLNELAAALGDDPNFATTVATSIGTKEPIITAGTTSQYWRGDKTWQTLPIYTLSGLGGQPQLNGTGFVKVSGTTVSYDNSTYYLASNPNGYITGISFANVSAKPTTIAGYGITDSLVYTTSTYSNPSWITALAWSKITGAPAFITSYTETDTLATVTGRGASTSTAVTFNASVTFAADKYRNPNSEYAIDLRNSDIIGANAIYFDDNAESSGEGINFWRSAGYWDTLRSEGGVLYYAPNRATASASTGFTVYHSGNLTNLNQLTNGPGYITGYTETDTLATVSSRGASTTTALTINADEGLKVIYNGTGGDVWIRGWGIESNRGAVYLRPTTNNTQTLLIGYNDGNQNWGTVLVGSGTFTWNGETVATRTWVTNQSYVTSSNWAVLGSPVSYNVDRTTKVSNGLAIYSAYLGGANSPHTYDISAQFIISGRGMEFSGSWHSPSATLAFRTLRDCCDNWSAWVTMLSSANYNSYSPTLTGGNASGTWGINVTGTAGSETLATVTGRGSSTSTNLTFSGQLSLNKSGTQLKISRLDSAAADWFFHSWASGLNIYPNAVGTVYFGRDGSATNVDVYNGTLYQQGNAVLHTANYSSYALPLSGGNITGRVEFQYSSDKYSQAWRNNTTGAYWWVTTESDKLGFHRNGDGDKFYFSNGGDFWSSGNGWLSTALAGKSNTGHDHNGVYVPINPDGDGAAWSYVDENPTINGVYLGGGQRFGADGDLNGGFLQARVINATNSGIINSAGGYYVGSLDFGSIGSATVNTTQVITSTGAIYARANLYVTGSGLDSPRFYMNGPSNSMIEMGDRTSSNTEVGYIKLRSGSTVTHDFTANTDVNYINSGSRFAIGSTTANGWLQVSGSHIGGYGIANFVSTDNAIIALESTGSYDIRLRYKYQGADKWFAGMSNSDVYRINNASDSSAITITQACNVSVPNGGLDANNYLVAGTFIRHSSGGSAVTTEYSGTLVTADNYPACNENARIYTIGTLNGGGGGNSFIEVEVFGSHRGYTPAGYVEYKKWIIYVGDRISSNFVASAGSDNNIGLWNGSNSNGLLGVYGDHVANGWVLRIIVNPSCGAGKSYTCKVKYSNLNMTHGPFTYSTHSSYSVSNPRSPHHTQWVEAGRHDSVVHDGSLIVPSGYAQIVARSSDTSGLIVQHPSNDYTIRSRASNGRDWAWYHSGDNFIFREPGVRTYMTFQHSSGKITMGDTDSQWDCQLRIHGDSGSSGYTTSDMNNILHLSRNSHAYIIFSSPNGYDQGMHFVNTSANAIVGRIAYQHSGSGLLSFSVNSDIRLQLNASGTLTASGDVVAYGSPSDARLKTIKEKVPNALDKILKLNGYRFDWNKVDSLTNIKEDVGVIAQEVEAVIPELARTNDDGQMSVRYQGLTAVLIEAIKEQQAQIESQKSEIEELKDLVKQLINR